MDVVLVAAGLDPSGGAGLIADLATVAARGLHPAGVVTALTVQDSARCARVVPCPPETIAAQIALLDEDLRIRAVKIGMVGTAEMAATLARALGPLARRGVPVVLDPVLRATAGAVFLDGEDPAAALGPLLAIATLCTPNRDEAARLLGRPVATDADRASAAAAIRTLGAQAVLIKGGHFDEDPVVDWLYDEAGAIALSVPRRAGATPHGTGCALATEIACALVERPALREGVALGHARFADRHTRARTVGRGRAFLPP